MQLIDAITSRASTRAFLERPVTDETIHAILDAARWAPSGANTQPWRVAVVSGESKQRISDAIIAAREAGQTENPDYQYYPNSWFSPYKERRVRSGLELYKALNIARDETEKRKEAWYNNYRFFGAPVGLLFFIDKELGQGSWLDFGMFLQNIMLAALEHDLATCPQAALAEYPDIIRDILGVSDQYSLVCGMSLGYPDSNAAINSYRLPREEVEAFTSWHR